MGVTQKLNWVSRSTLYRVEFYVNGLIVQYNRMVDDLKDSAQVMLDADPTKNIEASKIHSQFSDRFALDFHFYLICWDKVNKHLGRFANNQGENQCIKTIWDALSPLTSKAALGRHFLEHLDKIISRKQPEEFQYFIPNYDGFAFKYFDLDRDGKRVEKQIPLGRAEVEKVMKAYEGILRCLGADISAGYPSKVNVEKSEVTR